MALQIQELAFLVEELQKDLEQVTVKVSVGKGIITVYANGKGKYEHVRLNPEYLRPEKADYLGNLLVEAFNQAQQEVQKRLREHLRAKFPNLF